MPVLEKCSQLDCEDEAEYRVFWPGKPPKPMCQKHSDKAIDVGKAIGCYIHVEMITLANL